jgi:hypothetical protein
MNEINVILLALFAVLIIAAIYVYFSYTLMIIGRKTKTKKRWMAWVPVVQYYYICKIGKKPGWWMIFFVAPQIIDELLNSISIYIPILIISMIFMVLVWMDIAKRRKMNKWWGLLIVIPIVNLIMMGILAYSKK